MINMKLYNLLLSKFFHPTPMSGIILMLINTMALACLDILAKILREDVSASLIVFLYKFALLITLLPWIGSEGGKYFKTQKIHVHILRSITGTIGAIFFFHGLNYVHMADAAALENIQYLLIFVMGFVFFKEKITITKIIAILIGFLGALMVVNPGLLGLSIFNGRQSNNYVFTFIAICFWAINSIIIKILANTEHNKTQTFYILLFASIISMPGALFKFEEISILGLRFPLYPSFLDFCSIKFGIKHVIILIGMMISYFIHCSANFYAMKSEISLVIPFRYTKLVFSALLGYAVFGESSSHIAWVGYLLIAISGLMLVRYHVRLNQVHVAKI